MLTEQDLQLLSHMMDQKKVGEAIRFPLPKL